ncbi:MAG: hypothetical protein JSS02_03905 [Planctomycetes bacterium]|nr:hypothetical protein [Planctomycetota bacterium]
MTGVVTAQYRSHSVPGRGQKVKEVGDDFEDPEWGYIDNAPKASSNIDHDDRLPAGIAKNQRVYESTYRGQPDIVKQVETPPGGLKGSKYSLAMRSVQTGIPGRPSRKMQQDDLLINVSSLLGGPIPVSKSPSVVVRVFLPPFEQWEQRVGSSFGFRAELEGGSVREVPYKSLFSRTGTRMKRKHEAYWPGYFIQYNGKDGPKGEASAVLLIRAGLQGEEIVGPRITETGWWTLGMSFTPDGSTHYYAHAGVDPLTEKDHITTTKPYGHTAETLNTFFFNVVNGDDGRTWSTQWIVDDPSLYLYTR